MDTTRDYREYALSLKGERCEVCGSEEGIVVHHVDGDRTNNDLENLSPVCHEHHAKIHYGHESVREYVEELPETEIRETSGPASATRRTLSISQQTFEALEARKREDESWNDFGWRASGALDDVGRGPSGLSGEGRATDIADEIAERVVNKLVGMIRN